MIFDDRYEKTTITYDQPDEWNTYFYVKIKSSVGNKFEPISEWSLGHGHRQSKKIPSFDDE